MRLEDALLDSCLCQPDAPLGGDPRRLLVSDKSTAKQQLSDLKPWLNQQQTLLWANRRDAVLLLLQGPDCSGKDGVIRHVLSACNPQGLALHSFQAPSPAERAEHWLQRYRQRLPAPGLLGVFNRSYYEGLVSDVQDGLCPDAALASRRAEVATLETQLGQRRIHLLKCYLQLSRGEQRLRLERRLELPSKRWKLSRADLDAHRQFDSLQARWASELAASHSSAAPWYVIPADHRWQRDLLVASLLARTLERLQLDWPAQPAPFSLAELQACAG